MRIEPVIFGCACEAVELEDTGATIELELNGAVDPETVLVLIDCEAAVIIVLDTVLVTAVLAVLAPVELAAAPVCWLCPPSGTVEAEEDDGGKISCLLFLLASSSISIADLNFATCVLLASESSLSGVLPLPTVEAASSDIPAMAAVGGLGLLGLPGSSIPGTKL